MHKRPSNNFWNSVKTTIPNLNDDCIQTQSYKINQFTAHPYLYSAHSSTSSGPLCTAFCGYSTYLASQSIGELAL